MTTSYAVGQMVAALRAHQLDWLVTVPATGLGPLYQAYKSADRCIFATREEEGIAVACGLTLGGARPAVVMQQSGVGNALNAVLTLADAYEIHFPVIVCDRTTADPNPVQRVSSRRTAQILAALGYAIVDWEQPSAGDRLGFELGAKTRWILSPMAGGS
jgi:sulfopyruvate decarboxylase TPP-binding subunit